MAKNIDSLKFFTLIIKILIIYYATDIISRYYNNYDLITAITYRSGVSSFSSWQVDVSPTNGVQMSL